MNYAVPTIYVFGRKDTSRLVESISPILYIFTSSFPIHSDTLAASWEKLQLSSPGGAPGALSRRVL